MTHINAYIQEADEKRLVAEAAARDAKAALDALNERQNAGKPGSEPKPAPEAKIKEAAPAYEGEKKEHTAEVEYK